MKKPVLFFIVLTRPNFAFSQFPNLVASSNSAVCQENTLSLSATHDVVAGGTTSTYNWSGLNGFTSSVQNPQRSNEMLLYFVLEQILNYLIQTRQVAEQSVRIAGQALTDLVGQQLHPKFLIFKQQTLVRISLPLKQMVVLVQELTYTATTNLTLGNKTHLIIANTQTIQCSGRNITLFQE